jgi:hypothetical protein
MVAHEAASADILTSSLVLIAFVAMFIVISNKIETRYLLITRHKT